MVKVFVQMKENRVKLETEIFGSPEIVMKELVLGVQEVLGAMAKDMGITKKEVNAEFVQEFIKSTE